MPFLEVDQLYKSYPDGWTLSDVTFSVEEGRILSLLGPSGSGKTTLLRLIAGLELPEEGQVRIKGEDVARVPPHLRGFGLMFQEYALFPHKDVFGNVAFGLRMAGWERDAIRERVHEMLELVGLAGFERRDVNQLSGGERQRVALARSLAPQPRLLLLDEPLGALDRALRERLMEELPAILNRVGVTTITVTHDQEEAFAIADHILIMRAGQVVQVGRPRAVYRQPASPWVARFLGLTNLLDARVLGPHEVETGIGRFKVETQIDRETGTEVTLLVRPEAARLGDEGENVVTGHVERTSFRGSYCQLEIRLSEHVVLGFEWPVGESVPGEGERVTFSLRPDGLTLL